MSDAPRFTVEDVTLHERDVRLRMPFRFGVVTLTEAPQAFARARIRLADGLTAEGAAAELLAPKWFDKDPALSNEDNFDQLRLSLALARDAYLAAPVGTAFGLFAAHHAAHVGRCASHRLNPLVAGYGPALIDRAILDALCRALGLPFHRLMQRNLAGIAPGPLCPDLAGFDFDAFLATLSPSRRLDARHTVGLVDPITAADQSGRVGDGLPETLEEVVAAYGHRWFKLKVGGDVVADIDRLLAIAGVLDRIPGGYRASLDGNEQYDDVDGVLELWRRMQAEPRLARLVAGIAFIEQPIRRQNALSRSVEALSDEKPVIIDESDDSLDAFVRARQLGYRGVSSKTCKGLYKSLINRARCASWNRDAAAPAGGYFMSAEDLTIQAGLALQQDLALVSLLGVTHVERNGHHYVNGMAGLPDAEQAAFLAAHPDLYQRSHGAVRAQIVDGRLEIGSLDCTGYASAAMPDWSATTPMRAPAPRGVR
jgi:L-alanine-DL-glutamate epimerase-like enolase superfamily enzyme